MKVLVTGANGYLGQGVVKKLLDLGCEVVAADITTEYVDQRAQCISQDIMTLEDPFHSLGSPDYLLHMAWRNGFIHNSETHINDLPLHYAFLKKMAESGIQKIAVIGSMHEIGFFEGCIKEDTPCNPMNLYGISKNALCKMTILLCKENQVVFQWLRGYYIVGNSLNGSSIFSKISAAAQEGKTEFPFNSGQNQYDFLDYDIFCYQVAVSVYQNKITGIINICSGMPQTLASRVERFIKENKYSITLKYGEFPDRPYDSKAVWGDNRKIRRILSDAKH